MPAAPANASRNPLARLGFSRLATAQLVERWLRVHGDRPVTIDALRADLTARGLLRAAVGVPGGRYPADRIKHLEAIRIADWLAYFLENPLPRHDGSSAVLVRAVGGRYRIILPPSAESDHATAELVA